MKAAAIIPAAGGGVRLEAGKPKAFVTLSGRPMLFYTLRTLAGLDELVEVVIALPPGREEAARSEIKASGLKVPVKITPGGRERRDSVRIALQLVSAEAELVTIHDAARPLAPPSLFRSCLESAARCGAAIAAIAAMDTLKRVNHRRVTETVSRIGLWQAQTPQAFQRDLLVRAHAEALRSDRTATDDAELVERLGYTVEVVEGVASNFKITTRSDLELAAQLLSATD